MVIGEIVHIALRLAFFLHRPRFHLFIVQMPVRQFPARFAECPEVRSQRHAGKHFLEVGGVLFAVLRRMQYPVGVIEQVFLADLVVFIVCLKMFQPSVSNGVLAGIFFRHCFGQGQAQLFRFALLRNQGALFYGLAFWFALFIMVQREALTF